MSTFVCDHGPHLVNDRYERYDIRLEVRRSDGSKRPKCETVARSCREHYDDVFAACLGRIRENQEQGSLLT